MTIRWLHLSDAHEHQGTDYKRESMYENIIRVAAERNPKPHMVFLTGDLAFSGTRPEYDSLLERFIKVFIHLPLIRRAEEWRDGAGLGVRR
jgi:hypothetical protein